jgi:hypothetical protein
MPFVTFPIVSNELVVPMVLGPSRPMTAAYVAA